MKKKMSGIIKAMRLVQATLREIFDEAAYTRFLHRTRQRSSVQAYATFTRQREAGQARRPRCC